MSKPKIGIILSTTRTGRFADVDLVPGVNAMLDELAWWTHALKQARVEA